jgi:hypothetical protein
LTARHLSQQEIANLTMRMERTSEFDATAALMADLLFDPQTMVFLLRPLVTVEPIEPSTLPPKWVGGNYRTTMRLFGILPLGWQSIVVTEVVSDAAAGRWGFRDDGAGRLARRWDHRTLLEALPDGRSRYTDTVEVEAGLLTPAAWLFAWTVFAWRHHRWHRLLARQGHFPPLPQGTK